MEKLRRSKKGDTPVAGKEESKQEPGNENTEKKNKDQEVVKDGELITISPKELSKMIAEQVAKASGKSAAEIEQLDSQAVERGAYLSLEDIDKTDMLDVPEIYFSYSKFFGLYDDTKLGKTFYAPYKKPVRFKVVERYESNKSGSRFDKSIITISQVVVHSKKVAEFLDNHSLIDVKFFKSRTDAKNIDVSRADKMAQAVMSLGNKTQHQVIDLARRMKEDGHDINLTMDIGLVRKQIAELMVQDIITTSAKRTEELLTRNQANMENPVLIDEGDAPTGK